MLGRCGEHERCLTSLGVSAEQCGAGSVWCPKADPAGEKKQLVWGSGW